MEGEKANVLARARMDELAQAMQLASLASGEPLAADAIISAGAEDGGDNTNRNEMWGLAECRRSQLEELEMLEAMFVDVGAEELTSTLFFLVTNPERLASLKATVEEVSGDQTTTEIETLRSVAGHPPLEFALRMTMEDPRPPPPPIEAGGGAGEPSEPRPQLVASILLRVRFPARYPTPGSPPEVRVEEAMFTGQEPLGKDKVLSSLATLDDMKLVASMLVHGEPIMPDPCVYEMATWVTEHAFEFVHEHWA